MAEPGRRFKPSIFDEASSLTIWRRITERQPDHPVVDGVHVDVSPNKDRHFVAIGHFRSSSFSGLPTRYF